MTILVRAIPVALGLIGSLAAAAGSEPIADDDARLAEVTVTARLRSERLQDVPASIAAASGETIADLNVVEVPELHRVAPGLTFVTKPGRFGTGPAIAIRGISTFTQSPAVQDSVGTVLDGIPVSRAKAGAFPDLSDVERIEVLRGPQGTLFGKNASAGVISITTRDPGDAFESTIGLGYSSHNERALNASISGPLVEERLKGRISVYGKKRDGFVRNLQDGSEWDNDEQKGVRGKLVYRPTSNDTFRLTGDFLQQDNDAGMQTVRAFLPGTPQYVRDALGSIASTENDEILARSLGDNRQRASGVALQWDRVIGSHTVTAITGYRDWTQDSESGTYNWLTPLNEGNTFFWVDANQYSGELRIASPEQGRVEYVGGLFVFKDEIGSGLYDPDPGLLNVAADGTPLSRSQRNWINNTQTLNYAAFGEADLHLADRFTVTVGLRWTHEEVDATIVGLPTTPGLTRIVVPLGTTEDSKTASNVSWRLGGQWRMDEDRMFYVSAATGWKGPGFNVVSAIPGNAQPVDPEKSLSFEAGFKSQFLDRRLTANLNVFHANYEDFQTQGFVLVPGTQAALVLLSNAAELETRGVEAEFAARASDTTDIALNATYIDASFEEFIGAPCYAGQPVAAGQCSVVDGARQQDLTGKRLANTPKWAFNVLGRQRFTIPGSTWNGFATLDYSWRSSVQWDLLGHPQSMEDSYGLLGASLGIESENERLTVKVYGKNLTDEFHTSGILIGQAVTQFLPTDYRRVVGISGVFRF